MLPLETTALIRYIAWYHQRYVIDEIQCVKNSRYTYGDVLTTTADVIIGDIPDVDVEAIRFITPKEGDMETGYEIEKSTKI